MSARDDLLLRYLFPLRDDLLAGVIVPRDITQAEADCLAEYVRDLPLRIKEGA